MPKFNRTELDKSARNYGFTRDTFEKALRLKEILSYFNTNDELSSHLILKGGTAINFTIFKLPRLSVDIDMDFTPNLSKENTQDLRKRLTDIIQQYMEAEGYFLGNDSRFSHSLDAFHYKYQNAAGNQDMIKIELNYSLRSHIFEPEKRKLLSDAFEEQIDILTLSPMELFAAKTNALLGRSAPRDLYDYNNMIDLGLFADSPDMFRKCIIFYASVTSKSLDFDTSTIDRLTISKVKSALFPVLATHDYFDLDSRKKQAKEYIQGLMKSMTDSEKDYLSEIKAKSYRPELLFDDPNIIERIKTHPMSIWRTLQ